MYSKQEHEYTLCLPAPQHILLNSLYITHIYWTQLYYQILHFLTPSSYELLGVLLAKGIETKEPNPWLPLDDDDDDIEEGTVVTEDSSYNISSSFYTIILTCIHNIKSAIIFIKVTSLQSHLP